MHKFVRKASTYTTPGPCIIIIYLQKKKNTDGRNKGYSLYDVPKEQYLRDILSYLINMSS
jgi:hypothetical protein